MSAGTRTVRRRGVRWVMLAAAVSLVAGVCALAPAAQATSVAALPGVSSMSAGGEHSCAIVSGKAYCWGENYSGELGNGTNINSSLPVAVDTSGVLAGKTLIQITAGYEDTCALDDTGAAYCWGGNHYGQLGDGLTTNSSVPVAVHGGVSAGRTITQITAGIAHTCALESTGIAYCWGWNSYGQLGDGLTTNSSIPVAVHAGSVPPGQAFSQITAGFEATCAVDAAGASYCWGGNSYGQLGNGSTTSSSVPVAVATSGVLAGRTLAQISTGWSHTCAVDAAGTAYCWGRNDFGQLGDGSTIGSNIPVAVFGSGVLAGKTLTQMSIGARDTCALDATGAASCWGDNRYGELGDASTTGSSVPVAVDTGGVLAGKTLTQLTTGTWHACAADQAAIYCWGRNGSGELGNNGFGLQSLVPVLVGL